MAVYYINMLLILGLAFPLCIYKPAPWKKILYLVLTFGCMWFIATFRYGIGFDYFAYIDIFEQARRAGSLRELWDISSVYFGFNLLNRLLTLLIPEGNPVAMYGVYEILVLAPTAWFIYRYSKEIWLSTWLFVTITFFYTSMNFIRQSLACTLVLMAWPFLRRPWPKDLLDRARLRENALEILRGFVPYLALVLLASSFHITALIMLPVYVVAHFPLNKKWAIFYACATLLLFIFSEPIVTFVAERTVFAYYIDTIWLNEGLGLIFLIVPFLAFGACLSLYPAWRKRDGDASIFLNLALYSAIIWLFIVRHFILERFSMYVYIFMIVALPAAISALRASPEEREQLIALSAKGGSGKEHQAKVRSLRQKISDHEKYYWCAAIALVLVTAIYNDFGLNVNGFHGVVPYDWVFSQAMRLYSSTLAAAVMHAAAGVMSCLQGLL